MLEKYKYLGKNIIVFAISQFGTKLLSFLLVPLYTNILSTEEYGTADLIVTTATLLIYIFTINISDAVLRFSLEREKNQDRILSYGIRILTIGSILLLFALGVTWWSGLVSWNTSYYFFVFTYFLFTALYQILANYLRAIDKVTDVAIAGIISAIVMLVGNIVFLVFLRIGLTGYLLTHILGPLSGAIYAVIRINLPIKSYFSNSCDLETRIAMRKYSIPLIFNNISLWINAYLDKYFVTAMCGVDQNGIYAVASKIPTILTTCYTIFSMAWTLSAIKEFDEDDKDGFISDTYRVYNSFIVIVCAMLILINIPLARILYAKDFFVAWNYSSVMLISVMFNAMTAFQGSLFSAAKKTKVIALTTAVSAVVNISLNAILIPVLGVLGAAIATAICYAVMWGIRSVVLRQYIHLRITIIKDILAYCLLTIQVVFEHGTGHFYIGQIIVICLLLLLYMENFKRIIAVLLNKMRRISVDR